MSVGIDKFILSEDLRLKNLVSDTGEKFEGGLTNMVKREGGRFM